MADDLEASRTDERLVRGALVPFYNNFEVEHHAPSMRQAIKVY